MTPEIKILNKYVIVCNVAEEKGMHLNTTFFHLLLTYLTLRLRRFFFFCPDISFAFLLRFFFSHIVRI